MPEADHRPSTSPRTIDALVCDLQLFEPSKATQQYPWASRFVMGLPLAPWQREFKWTDEQCVRFIDSAWRGVYLGAYLVTAFEVKAGPDGKGVIFPPLTNMVIDGQQRLTAIQRYLSDEFAVPDAGGMPTRWSELDRFEQRRFRGTIFSRGEIAETNEMKLRQAYDLLNFGGTPHEEHERALDKSGRLSVERQRP